MRTTGAFVFAPVLVGRADYPDTCALTVSSQPVIIPISK
jgi:hypothetical protein